MKPRRDKPGFSLTRAPFYPTPLTPEDFMAISTGQTNILVIPVTTPVLKLLDGLVAAGLHGLTRQDVAERLICERLREIK